MSEKDLFYSRKNEPVKSCLLALRNLILDQDPLVIETVKYGMPCFCYGKKAFCYLWTAKKTGEPYILFVDGNLLYQPNLETGERKRMKILRVDPETNLPMSLISDLITKAIDLKKQSK